MQNNYNKNLIIKVYLLSIILSLIPIQIYSQEASNKIITLKRWLVTKPIQNDFLINKQLHNSFKEDFLIAIGGEESPKIMPSYKFKTPDGNINLFTEHTWQTDYIDLTNLFGRPHNVFTYLYAEVKSSANQGYYLHIGSNDGCKVWINGKLIIKHLSGRSAEPSQNVEKINLKKGSNSILIKLNQLGGGWGAYVQIYSLGAQKKFEKERAKLYSKSSEVATILETKVICKEPNRYIGWPTITKTSSGELLVVFSGNRDGHVCPYGITQMLRSKDNGKSWTKPETINNTPLDDRDAGIIETKNGTWIVSWFTSLAFDTKHNYVEHPEWKRHSEKLSDETKTKWLGNWIRRSSDKGKTWKKPIKQLVTAPHGPIELKDGRLLYVGTANINDKKVLAVEESKNDGKNWNIISTINIPDDESIAPYSEPHVVELPDGKLLAMFRYNPDDRTKSFLRQSESLDSGKTWTTTHRTDIWGYPPHLLLLKNGWLLVSYGVRRNPYSERACISKDGGKTWDVENEIILSTSNSGDLGYPASVQLDDGTILTVYYQINKEGEKTSLMQTHWMIK